MIRYNVKVNDQIYQVDLERDTTIHNAESTESSADICFEAIKAEYDYCVTRAEKLENKVYILLAACAFVFALLTTQIEKAGKLDVPQSGSKLLGIIIYTILLATVYKGNIIKNLIMDCQSYTKYRPNETTGGIFVSWRRKEELPTGA